MKYLLLFLFSLSFTVHSYAQTMTAYEKKCYSLKVQFLRNLGVDEALLKKTSNLSELEKLLAAGDFLQRLNTERGVRLMLALERELKDAEKLKTAVDFQRDKEKKEEAERKKQIEIAKQKERQKLEEVKKQEQERKERFENSDFVAVRNKIKENFNEWYQKGEFEKSDDYQSRISSYSAQAFDSICFANLIHAFKEKSGFSSKLLKYNADTEKFGVEFTFNDVTYKDSINIPINKASKFKDDFENFEIYVDDKDWVFVDNYLSPTKISFYNRDTKQNVEFQFSNINAKRIGFSSKEFGTTFSAANANFIFDDFYLKKIFEVKDASAMNSIAWENLLSKNFTKALQVLEKGIPLIADTDETYPYLLTNLAHAYLFTNQFEKAHKVYLDNQQRKLHDMTWKEAILQDFKDFKAKGISSPDMEKIRQEIESL